MNDLIISGLIALLIGSVGTLSYMLGRKAEKNEDFEEKKKTMEEVRHLRAVLEAEIARMACEKLTPADIDQLWENVALWRMYIERAQEEKIFELDKGFHRLLYVQCGCPYWYDLVENLAPHFDRTTILSFRCRPAKTIYEDHVSLLKAIEQKDAAAAHRIAGQHMQRYTENLLSLIHI